MSSLYHVRFVKPGDSEPGTVVPREVLEVREPCSHVVGVEKTSDGAVVRLLIPQHRRANSRIIILLALEKLREHFPYQPFVLNWGQPAYAMNEPQGDTSVAN